jgi:hypothetical protein
MTGRTVATAKTKPGSCGRMSRTIARLLFLAAILVFVPHAWQAEDGTAYAGDRPAAWKPAEQALLRVDGRPLTDWNLYQDGKKTNPLLVQMGSRYLLIDGRAKQVFELPPAKIGRKGTDLLWDPTDRPDKPLETSDWLVRDVGLAYKIVVKLVAEGHVIDVQLPHPLDIRSIH